jgi:hypothetical protein
VAGVEANPQPLAAGDNLTRDEFLRVWDAHPEIKFAELIRGVVYLRPQVCIDHGEVHAATSGWVCSYSMQTPGTRSCAGATTLMLDDSPQPDVSLRVLPEFGGQTSVAGKLL